MAAVRYSQIVNLSVLCRALLRRLRVAAVGEWARASWAGGVRGSPEAACLRARACNPAAVIVAVSLQINCCVQ
jgi:hypothetical protein